MEILFASDSQVLGRIGRFILSLSVLGALSCSTSPTSVKLPVALPQTFSASGESPLPDKWWHSLDDPTLDGLVERATSDNLTLRTIWDRLAQAEAVARKEGAALWPSVDGQAGASRAVQRGETWSAVNASGGRTYRTDLSLGLLTSYEADLWGRVRSTRDAAALDVRATEEQLRAAAMTLSAEVASTWYGLVEQYGQIDLLKQQLETNENVLELVTLRFRRGQVGAADVLRQRQLVEARRGDIAAAEARAAVLEHQLAILLGQPPSTRVAAPTTALVALPPLPATGLPATLVRRRPDVREAYYKVLAADRRVAAAIADHFPRISLSAQVDTSAEEVRDLFDNWMATLAANLVAPLFDAGARRAEVDRTRALVSERLHGYGHTVLEALSEVEDALVQESRQRELIRSLEKQLGLSRQVIERIRDTYIKGVVDYLRVLDALSTHQALQRSHLEARRQLVGFRIDLCRALGGGWEMSPPELEVLQAQAARTSEDEPM